MENRGMTATGEWWHVDISDRLINGGAYDAVTIGSQNLAMARRGGDREFIAEVKEEQRLAESQYRELVADIKFAMRSTTKTYSFDLTEKRFVARDAVGRSSSAEAKDVLIDFPEAAPAIIAFVEGIESWAMRIEWANDSIPGFSHRSTASFEFGRQADEAKAAYAEILSASPLDGQSPEFL